MVEYIVVLGPKKNYGGKLEDTGANLKELQMAKAGAIWAKNKFW